MTDYQPNDEVRITSATGGQKGQKSARLGGGDPLAFMELARVYGFGEEKYDRYNYLKGYRWSLSVDALLRHLFAFLSGEDRDPESGLLHTAHVAWHGQTLTSFILRGIGEDDRPPRLAAPAREFTTGGDVPEGMSPEETLAWLLSQPGLVHFEATIDEPLQVEVPIEAPVTETWGSGDGVIYEFGKHRE